MVTSSKRVSTSACRVWTVRSHSQSWTAHTKRVPIPKPRAGTSTSRLTWCKSQRPVHSHADSSNNADRNMTNPITPEGAASAQNSLPPVPTTKILAISHFIGAPMTPAQRAKIMPHEVHDTANAYLAGKIDQWYFRTDGKGVVFIVNASTPEEAKNILEKFPLGQAGLMGFDYIPLGPLSPLRIINDMVKGGTR